MWASWDICGSSEAWTAGKIDGETAELEKHECDERCGTVKAVGESRE
jgi:hypothetical protein